jgi:hypothetical protein
MNWNKVKISKTNISHASCQPDRWASGIKKTNFIRMKTPIQILILIFILMIPGSCHKDDTPAVYTLYNTWEVKEFISLLPVNFPKNKDKKLLLTFNQGGTYQLKLDVNTCSGTFDSSIANLIDVGFPACTELCCDSEFSSKFSDIMPSITTYSINGKILDLNVPNWGTVRLNLVE